MVDSRSYGGTPVEDRRRERRRRFLDAGLRLFGTDGYASTSVPAICKAAGLSSRQFYEAFDDREHLLRELYDELQELTMGAVADAFARIAEPLASGEATLLDGIEALTAAFVDCYAERPDRTRVSFVEVVGVSPAFEEHRREIRRRWSELLAGAAVAGGGRGLPETASDPLLWAGYIGGVNAMIVQYSETPGTDVRDVLSAMRRLLQPGILGDG